MGITQLSLDRINRHIQPKSKILIIGCQNMYDNEHYGEVAETYFESIGHDVISIDIDGCNGSYVADLRNDLSQSLWWGYFDLILQHGTIEHVDGSLYQPFKNIHEACKSGGIVIHENPNTGNWPGHGQHYFTPEFYAEFAANISYKVFEITEEAAMGNITDGWNVCAVLQKISDTEFISEEIFNEIYANHIKSK